MRISGAMAVTLMMLLVGASQCLAAEGWLELQGLGVLSNRVSVTVENPSDVPDDAALVHLPLGELGKALPDAKAGQVAVVDPSVKPAPREQADKNFVPFQISEGNLIFSMPLAAHEKKTLYIYSSPSALNLPSFPAKTAYDARHAYRSFENNFIAHRMETGPGANTTGMAIDAFGKTRAGHGLRLVELYEQGDYHHPQKWGVDILKIGNSPGIGGVYVVSGEQMVRPNSDTTIVDCVYQGPVETVVRATGPVEIVGRKVTVTRTLTLVGDDRSIRDRVEVAGEDLKGLELGIALRNLPNEKWVEETSQGYAMVNGDNNQPGCKAIGMAAVFKPSQYVRTATLPDEKNGAHVYVLKPSSEGTIVSEHRFTMIWDGDGQINNPTDLEKALKRWAALRDQPTKTTIAEKPESQP